ncbi:MAG: dockerin type I domain-containing protein [Thermoplasmatota archaeon]
MSAGKIAMALSVTILIGASILLIGFENTHLSIETVNSKNISNENNETANPASNNGGNLIVKIWLTSDHHCANDSVNEGGDPWPRYSAWEEALADFENRGIDYDMCLAIGDLWNSGVLTKDTDQLCAYQNGYPPISPILTPDNFPFNEADGNAQAWWEQTDMGSKIREAYYVTPGNHEAKIASAWTHWTTYIDPLGKNTATSGINNSRRPFPIVASRSQETYEILVGKNLRIIMIGEIKENGDHSGAYDWWTSRLAANSTDNFITCTHHTIDDGIISGHFTPEDFASSLYTTYLKNNADNHHNNIWLGGHWHFYGKWGLCHNQNATNNRNGDRVSYNATINCTTINVASITHRPFHSQSNYAPSYSYLLTLTHGSRIATISTYNHSGNCWDSINPYAPSISPKNFTITLSQPFLLTDTLGDINHDGRINVFDLVLVGQHWMETPTSPHWNPEIDLNFDGIINIFDLVILSQNWTG